MARKEFLDYVWTYCIEPQLGYSFSLNHTLPYSVIAVQEANLATRWNPLYWQCACLCVNSGNYVGDIGEESEDDGENQENSDVDLEEEQKTKKVAPNYTKISKAISDMQLSGVTIELPDINTSQEEFYPDVKNNAILYSLSAITGVSDSLYNKIISNRPYVSLDDFITKVEPTVGEMFCLIECGCFNKLLNKTTEQIVYLYAQKLAEENCPLKEKITATDLKKIVSLGYEPEQFNTEIRVLKYKMYIDKNQKDSANKRYLLTDETCKKFFMVYISDKLNMGKSEYYYLPDDVIGVKITAFEKAYNTIIQPLYQYLNSPDGLKKVQSIRKDNFLEELRNKYYTGTCADWQFKNMCFYRDKPAIFNINKIMYNIVNFNDLPETFDSKNICAVAGTVIGANNGKHVVSLLTDTGVVEVKFYAEAYIKYNQKISTVDSATNKKTVLDDSWFKRGANIIVYGSRRENVFAARNFKAESGYYRMVGLIEQINIDGSANIRYNRNKK